MEHVCRRARDRQRPLNATQVRQLIQLQARVERWVLDTEQGLPCALEGPDHQLLEELEADLQGKLSEDTPVTSGKVSELLELQIDDLLDAELTLDDVADDQAVSYLRTLLEQIDQLRQAASRIDQQQIVALCTALYEVHERLVEQTDRLHDADISPDLLQGYQALIGLFDDLASGIRPVLDDEVVRLLNRLRDRLQPVGPAMAAAAAPAPRPVASAPAPAPAVTPQPAAPAQIQRRVDRHHEPDLLPIFLEEAQELDLQINQAFAQWTEAPEQTAPLAALQRHLHTLKGGARMAQVSSVGDLAHEVETIYELLGQGRLTASASLIRFIRHVQDQLSQQIEQLNSEGTSFFCPDELSVLREFVQTRQQKGLKDFFSTAVAGSTNAAPAAPAAAVEHPAAVPEAAWSPLQHLAASWEEGLAPDPELLGIFLEEASEIVEATSAQLQQWISHPDDAKVLMELQRGLHTLKGGARMAQVSSVGDLSHELEFIYEKLVAHPGIPNPLLPGLLGMAHEWLEQAVPILQRGERPLLPDELLKAVTDYVAAPQSLTSLPVLQRAQPQAPVASTAVVAAQPEVQRVLDGAGLVRVDSGRSKPPSMHGEFVRQTSMDVGAGETLRVPAQLMEKMINLSGENAINRSRIEMQNSNLGTTIEEMGATIQRLADQLRRMEGELEAQILARHEEEHEANADFDPLEMDQYSSLNQLSKSLFESASDLMDLRRTLVDKVNDTDALLLQQSRIQGELQEGLMNARLVPFSRMVPRLQRVVRQVANEVGKAAELVINNAEGELDRTILDRIVAPLEHMLRNAVDHGLELPEQRRAAGKPEQGHISLTISREGNEIVLILQDDGRGIDVEAVRRKAIERKILTEASVVTDHEIQQLIFHAGLSTAQKITQISGRGVGMDVVQSEVKQLGGAVSVDSTLGQGTRFTLRLPVSVAVTDALMVQIGERVLVVPLAQIERIVRIPAQELVQRYRAKDGSIENGRDQYRLRYLGEYVHGQAQPNLEGQVGSLPVLLVRSESALLALQVDQLVGSRAEIVIKPIGQQLAGVEGVAGATILGDGSVVVILDVNSLARQAMNRRWMPMADEDVSTQKATARKLVMVVDDSVTVRKVTTRFLEREGFDVVTAKDGADAILKLEEVQPDLMLLDIEMPRMDGFEVATQVRHNPRLSGLPIIMITSRTGEKHRERAFQVGVDGYMGKPFQEKQLLENIQELLGLAAG
jgi:chemosensory pili system protein ChpA (sensor histidine kinase/response regulator)